MKTKSDKDTKPGLHFTLCTTNSLPMMPSETLISHSNPSPSPPLLTQPMTHSSNWLHRLRSSRGFPDTHHINLEHFLSTSQHTIHPTHSYQIPHTQLYSHDNNNNNNKPLKARHLINNVLSDLFCMGHSEDQPIVNTNTTCRSRTRSRKQLCPRICVVSNNSDVRNVRKDGDKVKEIDQLRECGEGGDLSKYSQTEVTVIDTSVECWKFEKVLYRRKNVWKVGDRKGKGLMSGDRKKRKERGNESGEGDVPKKKKLKKKLKLKLCSSFKYADKEGFDQGHDQGKVVAGNEKKRDNCTQVQEKSFCKKRIDEGSSVILIKSIPTTSKKNVSGVLNSCVKSTQR